MTRQISEKSTKELLSIFLKIEEQRIEAIRQFDIPASNRLQLKVAKALNALAASGGGRAEVENLLTAAPLHVRVVAAGAVLAWAPEKAIPVFGRLLDADLTSIASVDERLEIRISASDWLKAHFNLFGAHRNALIEPLKAYGVDLAWRDPEMWSRNRNAL